MHTRIAVVDLTHPGWTAGGTFTEMLLRLLRLAVGAQADIRVLNSADPTRWQGLAHPVKLQPIHSLPGEMRLRRWLHLQPPVGRVEQYCKATSISSLIQTIPDNMHAGPFPFKRISWIPDFQHLHLPELFSEQELALRNETFARTIRLSDTILLTGQSVLDDLCSFSPGSSAKAVVIRPPSLFVYSPPQGQPAIEPGYYGLPERFALVANQFWAHKNHRTVMQAAAILRKKGLRIPIALTGLPSDYRDPSNSPMSAVLQDIAINELAGQVIPLGLVPRGHLEALLRRASIVVQPSRFEGLSIIVQDAVALGRPLICSDIPIHRETAPHALGFFPPDEPETLAAILERVWPELSTGPDLRQERECLDRQQAIAREEGAKLRALLL